MYMRKMMKVICLILSLTLLINLGGFEVLAAEADSQQDKVEEADKVQNDKTVKETETDITADTGTDSVAEEEDSSSNNGKENVKADEPEKPEDTLPDNIADEKTQGSEEASGSAIDSENEEVEEKNTSIDEQATEVQTVQGNVEGIIAETVDKSDKKLKISWNRVADAVKYQVKTLEYPKGTLVRKADTTATSLEIEVVRGEKYYVEICALKENAGETTEIATGRIPVILLAKPSVKADSSSTDIKLSWKSVTGADKYQVVHEKKKKDVSETLYEVKKLKKNTEYNFRVQAICQLSENGKTYTYTSDTVELNVMTKKEKPAKVKKLTGIDGDKSAILNWTKASRAEGYIVYRYNATKKKWEVVKKDVKKLSYTDEKLKQGKIYKYRVAAYNNGGIGEKSSTVSISVKKSPGRVRTIGYKAVVKSRAPLFTSPTSKKRVRYLKAGTRITTIDYRSGRFKLSIRGKNYWIARGRLRYTASVWTKKDYSTKAKEDFVNRKGYKSPTKYLIWINHYTQRVAVYKGSKRNWKLVRSGPCATGTHLHQTSKGVYRITRKKEGVYYRYSYEKPLVYFHRGQAFHSRIKKYSGGYSDPTIGRPKSHGCVRLMDSDINFIYKYCPKGTTVVSY